MKNFKERAEKANEILRNIPDDEFSKGVLRYEKKAGIMTNEEWKKKNNFKETVPICANCKYSDYKPILDDDGYAYDVVQYCEIMPDKSNNIIYGDSVCDKFKSIKE